ncbi:hypothetical protein BJQ90_01720 [Arthrobacter sp. SO3]|nr:hypothetical protein [Arthrobacter sp. SO3]
MLDVVPGNIEIYLTPAARVLRTRPSGDIAGLAPPRWRLQSVVTERYVMRGVP